MTKRERGRPPHEPTDKDRHTVRSLCAYGLPEEHIAKIIGISPPTLRKHYRRELDLGLPMANVKAADCLHQFIERKIGTPKEWLAASIFRLKTQAGWRETDRLEHTGAGGGDIVIKISREDAG